MQPTIKELDLHIKKLLSSIEDFEDEKTLQLFKQLRSIKKQSYLTKKQLLQILCWKSPRPLKHYESNTEKEVKEITTLAFEVQNDTLKIHILTALKGVNFPSATAILMFYDRSKYPVLDIRVWKQLYKAKLVDTNSRGQNFSLKQCEKFFQVIRQLAKELNLTARQVEKRLFDYDKKKQIGNLYN
jgi:hypothetical protein